MVISKDEIIGISQSVLEGVANAAQSAHPNEVLFFLSATRADEIEDIRPTDGYVITEFLLASKTRTNPWSAKANPHHIPNTDNIVGSIHTHPNGTLQPSSEDLSVFQRGSIHIIMGYPYDKWKAFDSNGDQISLQLYKTGPIENEVLEDALEEIDEKYQE